MRFHAAACLAVLVGSILTLSGCSPASSNSSLTTTHDALEAAPDLDAAPLSWMSLGTLLPEGYAAPRVGGSVSLDGDTAVVGAPGDGDDATWTDQGAVYVFARSGASWALAQKITASDGAAGDGFGSAVALSGDALLVGAPLHDEGASDTGSVYQFVRSAGVFGDESKLPQSGRAAGRRFGSSLALAGDWAVVGVPLDDEAGLDAGAAQVFSRTGATFAEVQKLVAPDGEAGDAFGDAVSIVSDKVLIGAPLDDALAAYGGAAWAFSRSGSTFGAPQKLLPDNPTPARFGKFVALSSDSALVGTAPFTPSGAAYFFAMSGGTWSQTSTVSGDVRGVALSADTALVALAPGSVAPFSRNGSTWTAGTRVSISSLVTMAVSVSNGSFVVGFPDQRYPGDKSGGALVYTNTGGTWAKQADLVAGHGAGLDAFGSAVALAGDTAFVGAPGDGPWRGPFPPVDYGPRGSVFVYERAGASFVKRQELAPSEALAVHFGTSLAASGDTLIVGSAGMYPIIGWDGTWYDRPHGFADVFVRSNDGWVLQQTLVGSGAPSDGFGMRVALSGDTALVSAQDDLAHPAVYVFVRTGASWARQAVLLDDASDHVSFGNDLAISGNTAFVGASNEDTSVSESSGAVHVFVRTGQTWSRTQKLVPRGLGPLDAFGAGVALAGDHALVGSYSTSSSNGGGALYAYRRENGVWVEKQKVVAGENVFASPIALSGNTALATSRQAVRCYRRDDAGWTEGELVAPFTQTFGSGWSLALEETATVALVGGSAVARGGNLGAAAPFALQNGSSGSGGGAGTAGTGGAGTAGTGGVAGTAGTGLGGGAGNGGAGLAGNGGGGLAGTGTSGAAGDTGAGGSAGAGDTGGEAGAAGQNTGGQGGDDDSDGGTGGTSPGGAPGTGGSGDETTGDAGETPSDAGCGCRVLGTNAPHDAVWFIAVVLAVAAAARRKARGR